MGPDVDGLPDSPGKPVGVSIQYLCVFKLDVGEVQLAGYLEQTNLVTSHVTSQITSTVIKAPARAESSEQNLFLFV